MPGLVMGVCATLFLPWSIDYLVPDYISLGTRKLMAQHSLIMPCHQTEPG